MSVGPSALGTVLVQRLDAVLGTTMAAHANLISGARPDAVAQPGEAARPGQTDHASRSPRSPVDPAAGRGERGSTVGDTRQTDASGQTERSLVTRSDTTASAPTTLGQTARSILALLALYPEQAPPARGRGPLWLAPAGPPDAGIVRSSAHDAAATPRAGASHPTASQRFAGAATVGPAALPSGTAPAAGAGETRPAPALPPAAALATALRQALQGSGLFYESHLADLAYGKRSAEEIRSEPQATLPRAPQQSNVSAPRTQASPPGPATPAGATATSSPAPVPAGIHPDAAPLVRQQLDILANHTLSWQGDAWPGTPMEWDVCREAAHEGADGVAHWATRLKLDLPRLGLVEARLSLAGDQLVMQLVAPRSSREINGAAKSLRHTLQRAGLTLSHLSVSGAAASGSAP